MGPALQKMQDDDTANPAMLFVQAGAAAWNEKMQTLLGITPQNDREGVLQAVHWSLGAFGRGTRTAGTPDAVSSAICCRPIRRSVSFSSRG